MIPKRMNCKLAEEIGIHIGDGSMNIYCGRHLYSLRGHRIDDREYYQQHIKSLYQRLYNIKVHNRYWPEVIGFQRSSRALLTFKHNVLKFPLGRKNGITIPSIILDRKDHIGACIRGLFDTDGCIYIEKKSSNRIYPRIQIVSCSKPLILQLKNVLETVFKFNLSCWEIRRKEEGWKNLHNITVRGFENIEKWMDIIGSNNPKHIRKFRKIEK